MCLEVQRKGPDCCMSPAFATPERHRKYNQHEAAYDKDMLYWGSSLRQDTISTAATEAGSDDDDLPTPSLSVNPGCKLTPEWADLQRAEPPPQILHPQDSVSALGTYVLFLQPGPLSPLRESLENHRTHLYSEHGPDETALYPLHISVSSFFTISFTEGAVLPQERNRIRGHFHEEITALFESYVPSAPVTARVSGGVDDDGLRLRSCRVTSDKSIIAPLELNNLESIVALSRGTEDIIFSQRLSEDEGYSTAESSIEVDGSGTDDEDLSTGAGTKARSCLKIMRTRSQSSPNSTDGGNAISLKSGFHITFLGNKGRTRPLEPERVSASAQNLDEALTAGLSGGASQHWDLVLYELQSWGSVATGDRHRFVERARASQIATIKTKG